MQYHLLKYGYLSRASSSSFTSSEHLHHAVTLLQVVGITFSSCILAHCVPWNKCHRECPLFKPATLRQPYRSAGTQCLGIVEALEILLPSIPRQVLLGVLFPCISKYGDYLVGTLTCSQFSMSLRIHRCHSQGSAYICPHHIPLCWYFAVLSLKSAVLPHSAIQPIHIVITQYQKQHGCSN